MELTIQQIEVVKQYVDERLNYADLKLEVLDHMILDTENFLSKENREFEDAFQLTRLKWSKSLRNEKSMFYFGSLFPAPKIVLNKAKKSWRLYFFSYLLIYFMPLIAKKIIPNVNAEFIIMFENIIQPFIWIAFIIFNSVWFITIFSKIKTSYSFIIKTLVFMNVFYLFSLLKVGLFSKNGEINVIFMSFAFAGIYMAFVSVVFYRKHLQSVKSIQKIA